MILEILDPDSAKPRSGLSKANFGFNKAWIGIQQILGPDSVKPGCILSTENLDPGHLLEQAGVAIFLGAGRS
jgi:hypothetical protein